mgnify:CR=1 FL=1
MNSKDDLKALIEKYIEYKNANKAKEMSEESTRSWINELLKIFDWDILDTQQVQQEKIVDEEQKDKLSKIDSIHTKPDYSLVNGINVKAYLDAKKIDTDIFKNKKAAFQVRSYGWSAGLPCAFLCNFEQFAILDCRYMPQKGDDANIGAIQIPMENYIDEFDTMYNHLNRLLVYKNNLQKIYSSERTEGTQTVDDLFNKFLSKFRVTLANEIYLKNASFIDEEELNYYTQIILDRIIFIRVCESRKIEKEGMLLEFVNKGFWETFKNSCYARFYDHYDGAMFSKDSKFSKILLDNKIFNDFIFKLYYPYPYKFDVIPTKVIAKVYEEFLAYSLRIKNNAVVVELKSEYIKTKGAISTTDFIADAICKEIFANRKLEEPKDILDLKILDPCCGSGVFLIAAYEYLANAFMGFVSESNQWCIVNGDKKYLTIAAKQKIMTSCLFGIDCDPTAVEVTKMSLALKIVDDLDMTVLNEIGIFGDKILSGIHKNIIIGNTLVDVDIPCHSKDIKNIRPLNIKNTVYKSVFDEKQGFDYIIGNPPYVETKFFKADSLPVYEYLKNHYTVFEGKADLAILFIEKAMDLLNFGGSLGMIIQRRWFKTQYGRGIREFIAAGKYLHKLLDIETNSLFKGRVTYVSIMILTKQANEDVYYDWIRGDVSDVQLYFEFPRKLKQMEHSYFSSAIWAPELKSIFDIKNRYTKQYGTVGSNVNIALKDGIQALWKKMYDITEYSEENGLIIGKNGFGESVSIEKGMVKPVIYNKAFFPLKEMIPDAYRIFPYKGKENKTKLSMDEIKMEYPLAYKYLLDNKKKITEKVKCNGGEYWPTYTREHSHELLKRAKIIVPMTKKETCASLIHDKDMYMDNANVWFLIYEGDDIIVMKALTMIINSTIFSVFGKCGANQANNGYYKFNRQFIDPIPLPNVKINRSNVYINKLAVFYDEMKELLAEYEKASKTDKVYYKSVMDARWSLIDDCCYELYEISKEEKSMIESIGRTESRTPGGDED